MERRFTDQEMALILKRASERQASGDEAAHSLQSIQDIARQVGIDPQLVADAAATLDTSRRFSLLGAPSAYRISRPVGANGATGAIDQAKLLATIRDHMPVAGEARVIGDGMEWHAGPADNKTVVAVSPSEHGTQLRVDVRQHGPKAMAYLGGSMVGVIAGVVAVALWSVPGVAVGAAAFGASWAGTRAIWNRYAKRRDERMRALSDAVAQQLEGPASG